MGDSLCLPVSVVNCRCSLADLWYIRTTLPLIHVVMSANPINNEELFADAALQHWELAARLCGARDALRARIGSGVPPAYAAGYSRTVRAVRSALDADAFARAYERGGQLSLDETIAAALRAVDGS